MLILQPVSMHKIWGTPRLYNYCGDKNVDVIGLVYSASAIPTITNPIDSNEFQEKDFQSAVKNNPEKFGLPSDYEEFPIIVSFTAADADLSIQVHPTDEYAQKNEQAKYGKSESWYFIDEPNEGFIYTGSKESDKNLIDEKMNKGEFNDVIGRLEVKQDDLVFIPSGTLHALTAGSLVYEIQQSTDITYRFYDFDRVDVDGNKRELHTEKAIETLQPDNNAFLNKLEMDREIDEKPYSLLLTKLEKNYQNKTNIAQILTVLEGKYVINGEKIIRGMSIVVFPSEVIEVDSQHIGKVMIATPNIYL